MHCNAFAAKGISQSPIMSCSRRYHSVAAVFTAKGIIQYRPGRGWWDCTAWAKCDLRLPCFLLFQVPHQQPCTSQGNIWNGRAAYANFTSQCVACVDKKLKINLYINEIPAVCAADNPASNKWMCYREIWYCNKLSLYTFTHNSLTHANLCKPHVLPHMTAISIFSLHLISQVAVAKGWGQATGWAQWFMFASVLWLTLWMSCGFYVPLDTK